MSSDNRIVHVRVVRMIDTGSNIAATAAVVASRLSAEDKFELFAPE